jgi:hypothetical protein
MGKIALCGQRDAQLPQSMHSSGLMYNCETPAAAESSAEAGAMAATAHSGAQAKSLTQASVIT